MATSPEELDADLEEPEFVDDEDDDIPLPDDPDEGSDEDDEEPEADGADPSHEEEEAAEPDGTEGKPVDGAEQPAKAGDVPPVAQGAAPVSEALEAFRFTAEHKPYEVDGSYKTEDGGYYFPPAAVAQVQQLMSSGLHAPAYIRQAQQRIRELERKTSEPSEAEHKAKKILAHFAGMVEQGPEKVAEWLDNLKGNWDRLTLEYDRDAAERRAKAAETAQQSRTQESDSEVAEEQIQSSLERELYRLNDELGATAGGRYTDDEMVPLYRMLHRAKGAYFGRLPDGRLGVDRGALADAFREFVSVRGVPKKEVEAPRTLGQKPGIAGNGRLKAAPAADRRGRGPTTPPPKPKPAGARKTAVAPPTREADSPQWWRRRPPKTKEESDQFFELSADLQTKYARRWPSR